MTAPSRPFALVDCLNDLLFDLPRETFLARIPVNRGRRRGVVGVGGVDQDMVERDSGRLLDSPGRPVEHVAIDHQHVARDERDLAAVLVLEHHGAGTQLAFLAAGLARPDAAADHHRIVGDQDSAPRRLQIAGGDRGIASQPGSQASRA